jgi:hypothetical protein
MIIPEMLHYGTVPVDKYRFYLAEGMHVNVPGIDVNKEAYLDNENKDR